MKLDNTAGFTIIETMLFLGITALLIMGVLVGTGTSINIQRYHDSVTSLQSVLQQQFSDVSNASNDNAGNLACYGDGSTSARGQSNCVLLGRLISTPDGKTIYQRNIIGYEPDNLVLSQNDVSALQQYNIQVSPIPGETYSIEWGASIVRPGGNTPLTFSMLVLRSPASGVLRTFIIPNTYIDGSVVKDLQNLVNTPALAQTITACVSPNGLSSSGKSSVIIDAYSTSGSGIETKGEVSSGC